VPVPVVAPGVPVIGGPAVGGGLDHSFTVPGRGPPKATDQGPVRPGPRHGRIGTMASSGADADAGRAGRAVRAAPPGGALRTLASRSRMVLLHHLQHSDRPLPVDHLARVTGLHVNTTREHLDRLVDAGFVAADPEPRQARGRPRLLYRAVDRPAAASLDPWAREYLERLVQERYPDDEVAAGEPVVGQLVALEVHLEDLGFDPEVADERMKVHLRSCPV